MSFIVGDYAEGIGKQSGKRNVVLMRKRNVKRKKIISAFYEKWNENPHGGSIFHRSYIPSKMSLTQERYTTATASGRFFGAEGR